MILLLKKIELMIFTAKRAEGKAKSCGPGRREGKMSRAAVDAVDGP
jgi:hypothetical protein